MLTVDLVRARRSNGILTASYLAGVRVDRLLPTLQSYLETYARMVGQTRDDVEAALGALPVEARDRLVALGIRKVLQDACVYEGKDGEPAEALRRELFLRAAQAHRTLDVRELFDRDGILLELATNASTTPAALDAALYADLKGQEILTTPPCIEPEDVVARYNIGLAQAILLRATHVEIELTQENPERSRALFRAARFHELIHVVRQPAEGTHTIELSGPYGLFGAAQRYGFRIAVFLQSVLRCRSFELRASVVWGPDRTPHTFRITPEDGLTPSQMDGDEDPRGIGTFVQAFDRLKSEWEVRRNDGIFALPGEVVCIPDLAFENRETGEVAYLEVFGFWSRAAVWQRVELLRKGFVHRILLAVGKQLRVSEDVLDDGEASEIVIHRGTLSARVILERLRGSKPAKRA